MPGKATGKTGVHEPPDLERATALRPDVIARLELLRLVYRHDRTAADAIARAKELEEYMSGAG